MIRSEKIFAWVLALYFGIVFALGFSGQLDRWESTRYLLPDKLILFVGVMIVAFILLTNFCESFARILAPKNER